MRIRAVSAVALVITVTLWACVCRGASAAGPAYPAINIDQPQDHQRVNNPVLLLFDTTADMSTMLAGSTSGDTSGAQPAVYLHVVWDSTVVMPTADQITQVGQSEYQFDFPRLPPGVHQLRVYWGDSKTHRPVGPVASILFDVSHG